MIYMLIPVGTYIHKSVCFVYYFRDFISKDINIQTLIVVNKNVNLHSYVILNMRDG